MCFQAIQEIYDQVEDPRFEKISPAEIVEMKYQTISEFADEIYQKMPHMKTMKKNAQRHRHSEPELKNLFRN